MVISYLPQKYVTLQWSAKNLTGTKYFLLGIKWDEIPLEVIGLYRILCLIFFFYLSLTHFQHVMLDLWKSLTVPAPVMHLGTFELNRATLNHVTIKSYTKHFLGLCSV